MRVMHQQSRCQQQQQPRRQVPASCSSRRAARVQPRATTENSGASAAAAAASSRTDEQHRSLHNVLRDAGLELDKLQRHPEWAAVSAEQRVAPLLAYLGGPEGLRLPAPDIQVMLQRCPRLLSFSLQRQVLPVVAFLRSDLQFGDAQVAATLRAFPHILGYGVKSHLVPHCHYLRSLGVSEEQLPELILARPQVMGASIELIITYLRKYLRVQRTNVGRLLWSYPLDYHLPLPRPLLRSIIVEQEEEEDSEEQEDGGSSSGGPVADGSAAQQQQGPAAAQASSAGGDAGSGKEEGQQQQPPKQRAAPLGSRERCTWLEYTLGAGGEDGGGSEDASSSGVPSGDGGSSGGGPPSGPPPPAAA